MPPPSWGLFLFNMQGVIYYKDLLYIYSRE
jgi:hypothetical protein